MRRALFAALLLAADPVAAQPEFSLPTLFDVVDVGAGDVLNIRAAPDAGSEIIGRLKSDDRAIEVVGLDATGHWGRVNVGERAGWVAMRFLAHRADVWRNGSLPESLACHGTEPFWSLELDEGRVVLATPDTPELSMALVAALDARIAGDARRALVAEIRAGA